MPKFIIKKFIVMIKFISNSFSTTLNVVKKGTVVMLCMVLMGVFFVVGCKKDKSLATDTETTLQGTKWKLVGIVDAETGTLQELEPKDYEECYTITFDADSAFYFHTATNQLWAIFDIDYRVFNIKIHTIGGTEVVPYFDEILFRNTLYAVQSFSLQEKELLFYFNDKKNYLLYNKLNN